MSNLTDNNLVSPLLSSSKEDSKHDVQTTPVIIASVINKSPLQSKYSSNDQPNEYRFIHQRIPPKTGSLKYLLPILLIGFQIIFIVLFALFANYSDKTNNAKYPGKFFKIVYFY